MTVWVDDMYKYPAGQYRRMKMSHMITDNDSFDELHEMADKIGVARKWFQGDHYDICLSKRHLAVRHGAVETTWRDLALRLKNRHARMAKANPGANAVAPWPKE